MHYPCAFSLTVYLSQRTESALKSCRRRLHHGIKVRNRYPKHQIWPLTENKSQDTIPSTGTSRNNDCLNIRVFRNLSSKFAYIACGAGHCVSTIVTKPEINMEPDEGRLAIDPGDQRLRQPSPANTPRRLSTFHQAKLRLVLGSIQSFHPASQHINHQRYPSSFFILACLSLPLLRLIHSRPSLHSAVDLCADRLR